MIRALASAARLAKAHPARAAVVGATALGVGALIARGGDAEGLEAALGIGAVGTLVYAGVVEGRAHPHTSIASMLYQHPRETAAAAILAGAAIELAAAHGRFRDRQRTHAAALSRARATGRPLVVVGDPDNGAHTRLVRAYDCPAHGAVVDLVPSGNCANSIAHDITSGPTPGIADGSVVTVCHCTLEYVSDPHAAWRELLRMGGDPANVFLTTVQVSSLTASFYPGARWTITRAHEGAACITATPVTTARKIGTAAAVLALGAVAVL